jgi:hypothetical protein
VKMARRGEASGLQDAEGKSASSLLFERM